jgi:4-hydroxybenzoyl-CoA thioesterase/acyl-CoA thioester hydrolase
MPGFITSRQVEFAQTDMAGIVHFSEFFRYMESAEHEFFRSLGLSVTMKIEDVHISWPRVSCSFEFRKPLHFEDVFEIHMDILRLGAKSVTFGVQVVLQGELMAEGKSTSICCEMRPEGMKAVAIPPDVREKLEPYLKTRDSDTGNKSPPG